jgi:hypothetical protein
VRVAGDWTQPASASAVMQNKGSRIILRVLQSRRNPEYRTPGSEPDFGKLPKTGL